MIFWLILAAVLIIIGIVVLKKFDLYEDGWVLLGVIVIVVGIFINMFSIASRCDYLQFEKTFEIQKECFTEIKKQGTIEDNSLYVVDVLAANKKLTEYQGAKTQWGFFSNIPKRVFNIKPICIE